MDEFLYKYQNTFKKMISGFMLRVKSPWLVLVKFYIS